MTSHSTRDILPFPAAASLLLLTGCSEDTPRATKESTNSPSIADPPAAGRTALKDYSGSMTPGSHRVPLIRWDRTYPVDALVEVPDGLVTHGGWVLENGQNGTAYGDLMSFGDVDRVDTHPCGGGPPIKPGPTVRDLAEALTAQVPRGTTTTPKPVTVGGHRGLDVETSVPRDLSQCDGGQFTLWNVNPADPFGYSADQPGTVCHGWILHVDGQRVAVAVKVVPGPTTNAADFVDMAETAKFLENADG